MIYNKLCISLWQSSIPSSSKSTSSNWLVLLICVTDKEVFVCHSKNKKKNLINLDLIQRILPVCSSSESPSSSLSTQVLILSSPWSSSSKQPHESAWISAQYITSSWLWGPIYNWNIFIEKKETI